MAGAGPEHEDEEDVCRVCRVEGDDADPLVHPCRCSGSVRFVHPDCLRQWLAQTGKKHCEICGYKYHFTKIYPVDLPESIPPLIYARQGLLWAYRQQLWLARCCLVIFTWLIVLPSANMFTLRSLMWIADSIASGKAKTENTSLGQVISNITVAVVNSTNYTSQPSTSKNLTSAVTINATSNSTNIGVEEDASMTLPEYLMLLVEKWVKGDENRGQVLSISIAAVVIGLILLREWITQHNWQEHERAHDHLEEGEINPDEWIVMNGIARRTADVIAAMLRMDRERIRPRGDHRTFVELAQQQREAKAKDERAILAAVVERAIASTGSDSESEPDEEGGTRSDGGSDNASSTNAQVVNATDGPISPHAAVEPTSTIDASLYAYRERHRLAELERERIAQADIAGPAGSEEAGSQSQAEDRQPTLSASSEAEAGPSRPRFGRGATTTSEAARARGSVSPKLDDVAYTAPELLSDDGTGKGKARAMSDGEGSIDDGPSDRIEGDDAVPGDMPLFMPPSPNRSVKSDDTYSGLDEDRIAVDLAEIRKVLAAQSNIGVPPWLRDAADGQEDGDDEDDWEDEGEGDEAEGGQVDHLFEPVHRDIQERHDLIRARAEEAAGVAAEMAPAVPGGRRRGRLPDAEGPDAGALAAADGQEEPWDGEDWNGILEVVGLIGPLHGLFQNLVFGLIIMGASITFFIGLPMIIGKLVLCIDPIRTVISVSTRTIQLVRRITDPIVDVIYEIVRDVVVLPLLASIRAAETIIVRKMGMDESHTYVDVVKRLFTSDSMSTPGQTDGQSQHTYVNRVGDVLAWTGEHAYDFYTASMVVTGDIASSTAMRDRVLCAIAGWTFFGSLVALLALVGENGGAAARGLSRGIKEHALFFKLAFFMLLELGVFPLMVGFMMDVCMLPLWPGATLAGRLERLQASPFGPIFVAWLTGTMFMYQFANLLSHIRTLCRPGTLFFIRDPADPSYSPLGTSAIMYSVIVFSLVGVVPWGLALLPTSDFLPLRVDRTFGPLTSIPFDLLFLHLVIPPTLRLMRPKPRGRRLMAIWWQITVSLFKLDPLMTSKRQKPTWPVSKLRPVLEKVWPLIDPLFQVGFGKYDPRSTKARVPSSDQVILIPAHIRRIEGGVFIPLSEQGTPLNPEDKLRLLKQDRKARERGHDPREDYEVIRLPAYWRTRVHAFIGATLAAAAIVLAVLTLGPLTIGRMALGWSRKNGAHDGYTWLTGTYIIYFSLSLGATARHNIIAWTKAGRYRRSGRSTRIKRIVMAYLAAGYGVVMLYGVVPVLLGLLLEIYGTCFTHVGRKGRMIVHFWDVWALGLVVCSLAVALASSVVRFRPVPGTYRHALKERFRRPITSDFAKTNDIVKPLIVYLLLPVLAPFFLAFLTAQVTGRRYEPEVYQGLFQALIPLLLRLFVAMVIKRYLSSEWGALRQQVIDAEYVIEERVDDYDPATDVPVAEEEKSESSEEDDDGEERDDDVGEDVAEGVDRAVEAVDGGEGDEGAEWLDEAD
ncbi:hypothetical protein IAU60_006269 [Kwoniella sp. DSM 27419]